MFNYYTHGRFLKKALLFLLEIYCRECLGILFSTFD